MMNYYNSMKKHDLINNTGLLFANKNCYLRNYKPLLATGYIGILAYTCLALVTR